MQQAHLCQLWGSEGRKRVRVAALILCGIVLLPACGSVESRPPLFAAVDLPLTLIEFRLRLDDFSEYFFAVIEDSSETVIDGSDDQAVRRNAMEFRLRAVTVFLNALAKPDPVAALVDAWAFSLQLVDFLEQDGAGAHLFGEYQHVMVDAARSVAAEVDDLVEEVTRDDAVEGRELVAQWVSANPLSSRQMIRSSTTILLADELEAAEDSPFAALGRLQLGIDDITATLQRYTSIFPRTIRWHSQLILHETLYDEFDLGSTREMVDSMLADLADLGELADELLATLPSGEELDAELAAAMARLQGAIDEERARLLAEVDRQRGLVFDDVTAQREAIMSDVEAQILLAQERIQAQVDEVFARIESLTEETITRSFAESERLVRLVYSRVLILLLVAIAGGAGLILLNKWRRPIET